MFLDFNSSSWDLAKNVRVNFSVQLPHLPRQLTQHSINVILVQLVHNRQRLHAYKP